MSNQSKVPFKTSYNCKNSTKINKTGKIKSQIKLLLFKLNFQINLNILK